MNKRRKSLAELSALQQLVRQVADAGGVTLKVARHQLETAVEEITTKTLHTGRFHWPGFGTWKRTVRAARNVVNPQTHEIMRLEETKGVRWRPAREILKKAQRARGGR